MEPSAQATNDAEGATSLSPIPSWLLTPPTVGINPPVTTREQELPFAELTWKNFERLCLRLAAKEAKVEHCQLYGVPGQDQAGIDLYARVSFNPKYRVYQCKNEAGFTANKICRQETPTPGLWINKIRGTQKEVCTEIGLSLLSESQVRLDKVSIGRSEGGGYL